MSGQWLGQLGGGGHSSCPNLFHQYLVLGETGDGCHQPTVSQHALVCVKPAGSSSEEVRVRADLLEGGGGGGGGQAGNVNMDFKYQEWATTMEYGLTKK